MTWAHVQSGGNYSTSSVASLTATFGSTVTAGDLIVVGFQCGATSLTSVRDSVNSASYAAAVTYYWTAGAVLGGIYWYVAPLGGSSFAVTLTPASSSYSVMTIDEYSFTAGASITVAGTTTANAGGTATTTPNPGPVTFSGSVLSYGMFGGRATTGGTITPASGYALRYSVAPAVGSNYGIAAEDLVNDSSSPATPNFTISVATYWLACAAMFSATGGGVYVPFHQLYRGSNLSLMDTP
jgi:hypothetical protein